MNRLTSLPGLYINYVDDLLGRYSLVNLNFSLARTLLALGTLFTLLLNDPSLLFNPTNVSNPNHQFLALNRISVFYLLRHHLFLAKWIAVLILGVVASGIVPRMTCFFHWWISFSVATSCFVIEGGDHITQILTLLLIPVTIFDKRINHWKVSADQNSKFKMNVLIYVVYTLIRIQVGFIYLEASIGKLKVNEWADGTALYYWFNNHFVGSSSLVTPMVHFITSHAALLTICTWGSILFEFVLFLSLVAFEKQRKLLLVSGIVFHFLIFVFYGLFSFFFAMTGALLLYLSNFKNVKNG